MTLSVSACLIVRDEAGQLADCLRSVTPFVTEIVVADTGSTDDTVAVAKANGARVVRIGWADDFAAARNAALAECTGDWVLSLDADERVEGEPEWLQVLLEAASGEVDALSLLVVQSGGFNPRGHTRHRATKLFRRGRCSWRGRVHERLVYPDGSDVTAVPPLDEALRLVHHGYADPQVAVEKSARNARLAELEIADLTAAGASSGELDRALLDLGRSRLAAGDREGGRAALAQLRERTRPGAEAWLWATDFLAWDAVRHHQAEAADAFAGELGAVGVPADYLRHLAAQIAYLRGETERGDVLTAAVTTRVTVTGRPA